MDSAYGNCLDNLKEKDIALLKEYFNGFDYRGAGYTFLANYIWRNSYCICWERISDYLVLAGTDCTTGKPRSMISMPLTRDGSYDTSKLRKLILDAKERFERRGVKFTIRLIPGHMVRFLKEAFPNKMKFTHDRDNDEYVYEKDKLIYLPGRALHRKKNHLNYFNRNYASRTEPLRRSMLAQVMYLTDRVKEERSYTEEELESLEAERDAIKEIFRYLDDPNVYGTAIMINGRLEAYAIGERLNKDTAVEHFEKANDNIRGLYQAICSEWCKALPQDIAFINREEDMGLENLRHAKESLRPHHMEEKFSGCFLS